MAYQHVQGYFIPRRKETAFTVHSYLHFCVAVSLELFVHSYMISSFPIKQIIGTQSYSFKYTFLTLIIMISSNHFNLITVTFLNSYIVSNC